jgi:predicted N-acyltransferase
MKNDRTIAHFDSIFHLPTTVQDALQPFPMASHPRWYQAIESEYNCQPDHLLITEKSNDRSMRMVPLYHFIKPHSQSSHDLFYLLEGGYCGNQLAQPKKDLNQYPVSILVPPNAYRFMIAASDKTIVELDQSDVRYAEERCWQQGSKVIAFLFVEQSNTTLRHTLTTSGFKAFPVLMRWTFDGSQANSLDQFCNSLPRNKRRRIRQDLRKIRESNFQSEMWSSVDYAKNQPLIEDLISGHFTRYGQTEQEIKRVTNFVSNWVNQFSQELYLQVIRNPTYAIGFVLGLRTSQELYIKFCGFREGIKYAYFDSGYYQPMKLTMQHKLMADFGVGADETKWYRGLAPHLLFAYVKFRYPSKREEELVSINSQHKEYFRRFGLII